MARREMRYAVLSLEGPLEEWLLLLLLPRAVLLLGNSKLRLSKLGWWLAMLLRRV
jgi:hypothetical protein